jgi:subfamily B ATP-binding cassette protein MsbA
MTDAARIPSAAPPGTLAALRLGAREMYRQPLLAGALLVVTLAQGALQGLLLWVLREVLLRFDARHGASAQVLALGASLVFGLWALRAGSTFAGEALSAKLAHGAEMDWMRRVLGKLLTLPMRFFDRTANADLVMAVYQDVKAIRQVTLDVATIILYAARLAGLAVAAFLIHPWLAAIGAVVVPFGLVPAQAIGHRITTAARRERETMTGLIDGFLQVAVGIRIVKVNRIERQVLTRAAAASQELLRLFVRQARGRGLSRFLFELVSGLGLVLVLAIGGREVAAGRLAWQSLLSLLLAVLAVYAPMLGLLQVYAGIRTAMPNLERIGEVLSAEPEPPDPPTARPLRGPPATIALERVTFRYGGDVVLDDVSLSISRGERIGIVGPSGAGKSTLLSLLLRLYDPTEGRILLDGVDLRTIRRDDVLAQCALVPQEPFLFDDTIAGNIRLGRPDAPLADVVAAAQAAYVHDEIMAMERGYETRLGRQRDGRGLSAGQRQRLCIAAALLRDAPILLLDEATSSLDAVSERAVQAAIDRLVAGRTTFMVAHRLSTLAGVDRIVVLEGGRLAGLGTHAELLAGCPTYERLWRLQTVAHSPGAGAGVAVPAHQGALP